MTIEIREVKSTRDLKDFIYLPEEIHKNHSNWVPPIYMDEFGFFNPKKNHSFEYCKTILLLAFKDDVPVGRIMGIINHRYNDEHHESNARFSFFESYEDFEVAEVLVQKIEEWAKSNGMTKIVGPLGFSDKDPQGFMIEGYNEPVVIASNCNYPFMSDFMSRMGYQKEVDLFVYKVIIPEEMPPFYQKIEERFKRNNKNLRVKEFTSRRKVRPYIRPVLHLLNKTFSEIYGFSPYEEKEMDDFANRYLYLISPRLIKIICDQDDQVVAFVVGMADISKGVKKAKGRLIPFGFIHVLIAARKSKQLNLLLGGIHPDYRDRGLDVVMGMKMLESARKMGKEYLDSHLELETNTKMRAEMERMNGEVYKKYRIFQKGLS